MKKAILLSILFYLLISSVEANPITIDVNRVQIYMKSSEIEPINVAYNYLNRDFNKITGKNFVFNKVKSYQTIPKDKWAIIILNNANCFSDLPVELKNKVTGYESHRIYVDKLSKQIIIQGYDIRGTIFAIYTFSENILGVPPLWFWSSWKPESKTKLSIPDDLNIFFDVPAVRYRSFFLNDTDLFTPFARLNNVNKNVWIETMMRLKLNTTEQNTVIDVVNNQLDETGQNIKKHGMILTSHHETILNIEFNKWKEYWTKVRRYDNPPALLLKNEKELLEFWRYAVELVNKSGIENVWVIGLRGSGDRPFWSTFEDAPKSAKERGLVINNLFIKQMQIIRDVTGNPAPETRIILYNELAVLYADGYLIPPTGKNIILTFSAVRQDPYPNRDFVNYHPAELSRIGYYMNLAFYTTGCHLTQGEGPWKMESNYSYILNRANIQLDYSVLNVGNLREFLLTAEANARMMWKPDSYATNDFIVKFCDTYYGKTNSLEVAKLYSGFFNAFWEQQKSTFPGMERQYIFEDLRIKNAIVRFCDLFFKPTMETPLTDVDGRSYQIVPTNSNALNQVDAVINGMTASISRWENVTSTADSIYSRLPQSYKMFFNDNLRTQAHFMHQISIALLNTTLAYKNKSNPIFASEYLDKGLRAMGKAKNYLYESQHGAFDSWLEPDAGRSGKFNIPNVEDRIKQLRNNLQIGLKQP